MYLVYTEVFVRLYYRKCIHTDMVCTGMVAGHTLQLLVLSDSDLSSIREADEHVPTMH